MLPQELDLALQPADLVFQRLIFDDDLKQFSGQLTRHVACGFFEDSSDTFVFIFILQRVV